jgi:hypothetical protein
MTASSATSLHFFLGGADLEMRTIRQLLTDHGVQCSDAGLAWGAKASSYLPELRACHSAAQTPVLVELEPDLPQDLQQHCRIVDHHGPRAGRTTPTSLEQVFTLLHLPQESWTRFHQLVSANDRGHIRAMQALTPPATAEEIRRIRDADLRVQGATDDDFSVAAIAAATAVQHCQGRLTVATTEGREVLVAELLEPFFGGPGFQNLLVSGPRTTTFFGSGRWVQKLADHCGSPTKFWFGGDLPDFGYWGAETLGLSFDPLSAIVSWLAADAGV